MTSGINKIYSYNARMRMSEATHLISLYRATAAALESTGPFVESKTMADVVQANKDQMILEESLLSHQISIHDVVDTMTPEEQADVVYAAFSPRSKHHIESAELEMGLKKLRTISKREYPSGEEMVKIFANRRNGHVRREDFGSVIDALAALSLDCSSVDMCHLLLHVLLFSKSGVEIIVETVSSIAGQSRFRIDEAVTEARLVLLYKAMSQGSSDTVPVKDIFKAIVPLTQKAEEIQRRSLLALQYWNLRKLDYELFSEHMTELLSCFPGTTLNELIKKMTVTICSGETVDDDIMDFKNHDSGSSIGSSLESLDSSDNITSSSSSLTRGDSSSRLRDLFRYK